MDIRIENLTHAFEDGRIILDNICFSGNIKTTAIIGPSGGGKSTLLRILAGLIEHKAGSVSVMGTELENVYSEKMLAYRRQIGFVSQQGGLFNHLSALENITLPLTKVHGYSEKEAEQKAMSLLDRFGLQHEAHKKPKALSGGQRQRIAIAKAIAPNPKALFLDEPTSALDPEYTVEVLNMINQLKSDGMDFLIVTHEMGFAREACDTTAFLYDGKILEYGLSEKLFANPETQQLKRFTDTLLSWS